MKYSILSKGLPIILLAFSFSLLNCGAPKNITRLVNNQCKLIPYALSGHGISYTHPFYTCRDSCTQIENSLCTDLGWTPAYKKSGLYTNDSVNHNKVSLEECRSWTPGPEGYMCNDCNHWEKSSPIPLTRYKFNCLDTRKLNPWPKDSLAEPFRVSGPLPVRKQPVRIKRKPFESYTYWAFHKFYFEKDSSLFDMTNTDLVHYLDSMGIKRYELTLKRDKILLEKDDFNITYDFANLCADEPKITDKTNRMIVHTTNTDWLKKAFSWLKEMLGSNYTNDKTKAIWEYNNKTATLEITEFEGKSFLLFTIKKGCL
ncbi:MAG: hypothetical protein HQK83_12525 [Fibrobacteria bacterium]|nr:hypothetical protein [Fibrobacteria bacterium]